MNWLRVGKYGFRLGGAIVGILVILIIAAPVLGVITAQYSPHDEYGVGLDLNAVNSQLDQLFSSGAIITGSNTVAVPAFNNWFIPATVSLSLGLTVNGSTVYQTPQSTLNLPAYHSGTLNLTVSLTPSEVAQLEGHQVGGSGVMTLKEGSFWTITVNLGAS